MNVETLPNPDSLVPDTVLIVPFFEGDSVPDFTSLPGIDTATLTRLIEQGMVVGRRYNIAPIMRANASPLVLVGAGKRQDLTPFLLKRVSAAAARFLAGRGFRTLAFFLRGQTDETAAQAVVEGAIEGQYNPGLFKTRGRDDHHIETFTVVGPGNLDHAVRTGTIVGEAITIARDLVNLPPNELTPSIFATKAVDLAGSHGLQHEVLDEKAMRDLGMGGILGVAQGSEQPPRFIILRYGTENAPIKLALCGKGLTFDSGGLSLKTGEGMMTMKTDMGGGAAVLGGILAISRLAPQQVHVTAYIGATENMPGGGAMRPGDVLRAMNGETIEVLNTDAEGRIVLADVLSYAVDHGATHLLDFATLTGAANVALGGAAMLAVGNDRQWVDRVVGASDRGLERAWPMPLYEEYREAMNSDVADIKNVSGNRGAGALTAAAFLSDFAGDTPWTHMDIAGGAFRQQSTPFASSGATGVGVGTIAALANALSQP